MKIFREVKGLPDPDAPVVEETAGVAEEVETLEEKPVEVVEEETTTEE